MNLKRLRLNIGYNLKLSSQKRGAYCKKHNVFHSMGNDVRLPTMLLPLYPKLVSFHNNVEIASRVQFVVHDAIHEVINRDQSGINVTENIGCIEIMDNVFIGAGTTILPGVRIGPNAIIGAESVVNKDIPPNSVCVGVPARQVGTYEDYVKKYRAEHATSDKSFSVDEYIEQCWVDFHAKRD